MGSGRTVAASTHLPKINSETYLAVQLLLSVSDARCNPSTFKHHYPLQKHHARQRPKHLPTPQLHSDSATPSDNPQTADDRSDSSEEPASDPSSGMPHHRTPHMICTSNNQHTHHLLSLAHLPQQSSIPTTIPLTPSTTPSTSSSPVCVARPHTPLFKYSREERLEALQRFREKKRRRQYRKRVRYHVRKRLAEARPRYKGRFSKPPADDSSEEASPTLQPPASKMKSAANPPSKALSVTD